MTPSRKKTLVYFALCLALVAVAVFWVGTETSWAQRAVPGVSAAAPAAATTQGSGSRFTQSLQGLSSTLGGFAANTAIGVIILHAVVFAAYELLFYLLALAGTLLNYFYTINLLATPGSLVVVQAGWTTLRDLANGVFILLVLWVAITIIFNLETLGGKRLLVRIIVIALLINFSLLMVTVVFAFTNQVARTFARPLGLDPFSITTPKTGISDFIVKNTRIHTVAQVIKDKGVADQLTAEAESMARRAHEEASRAAGTSSDPPTTLPEPFTKGLPGYFFATLQQSLGIPYVVPEAKAIEAGTVSTGAGLIASACFLGGLVIGIPTGPGALATAAGAASLCTSLAVLTSLGAGLFAFLGGSGGPVAWEFNTITNLAVADIFLLLTTVAMFAAMILLAVRYIAMHLIAIFAPIAFLAYALPRYGDRIWNMWLDNLFRWAFVAPVFYFLLYLSLLMLKIASDAQAQYPSAKDVPFPGNAISILGFVMFLVFFWASIFLTRKTAGMGAEAALAFGKKLAGVGLGVGTGLLARRALPWIGRAATGLQEKINQSPLARATFGRGLTAYGLGTATRASRKQLADLQAKINQEGHSSVELQQRLASGYYKSDTAVAAVIGVLKSRGDLDRQAGVEGYSAEHLERAANVYRGLKTDLVPLMRANPTIATRADFNPAEFDTTNPRSVINEVLGTAGRSGTAPTPADIQRAIELLAWRRLRPQDVDTFDLDILKYDANKRRFLEVATGDHLSRLGRRDTRVAEDLQTYLDNPANKGLLWDRFSDAKQQYFISSTARGIGVWHLPPYAGGVVKQDTSFRALQPVVSASAPTGTPAYTGPSLVGGGTPPYTATLRNGALPAGLSIDPATGQLGGSTVGIPADSTFVADYDITDSSGTTRTERVSIHITIT